MIMAKHAELIVTLIFISGCAMQAERPDWINGESHRYPVKDYLSASGSADKPEEATNRALANLARIFEVEVEDSTIDQSRAELQSRGDEVTRQNSQLAVRYVNAYTHKLLEGAEVVQSWHDNGNMRYYALAVISRAQLATRLKTEIAGRDRETQSRLNQSHQASDTLDALRYLNQACLLQYDRESFQRDLQIVDRNGKGVQPRWTSLELDADIQKHLTQLKVSTSLIVDDLNAIQNDTPAERHAWHQLLQGALASIGVTAISAPTDYTLQLGLEREDLGYQEGWYWLRGIMELRLRDAQSGQVRSLSRWPLKTAGQTRQQAEMRLKSEGLKILKEQIKNILLTKEP